MNANNHINHYLNSLTVFNCVAHMVKTHLFCPKHVRKMCGQGTFELSVRGKNVLILAAKNDMAVKTAALKKGGI